jgi:hypothetical protein
MFRSKSQKDLKKRMLLKKTTREMGKQIRALDNQKEAFIQDGKEAYEKGLKQQFNLAVSGLRITLSQKKKVESMLLNLRITSQLKDISQMTVDFLGQMKSVSKEMIKLTNEKAFQKVAAEFDFAMDRFATQTDQMESFLEDSDTSFQDTMVDQDDINDDEIINLILDGLNRDKAKDSSFEAFKDSVLKNKQ